MDNEAKNEILAAIQNINVKIDVMQEQIAKIPEMQEQIAKIPEMQKQIAKIPEMQKQVAKIPEMQKEIAKIPLIQEDIARMEENIRNVSRSVAVIEHEHGDKLKALFDAFISNTQKIERQEENIKFCEKKLENHDMEMDFLINKVQGL